MLSSKNPDQTKQNKTKNCILMVPMEINEYTVNSLNLCIISEKKILGKNLTPIHKFGVWISFYFLKWATYIQAVRLPL